MTATGFRIGRWCGAHSAALLAALLAVPGRLTATPPATGFTLEKLADGVYAAIRREPPSLYFESNSLFIIGDREVIVVDAQFSLASARAVLAALRQLTDKPVRYVINTHGHDDHVTGNQVYRAAYPDVEFIAQAATRDTMVAAGAAKRKEFVANLPGTLGYFRQLLTEGKGPDGEPLTEEERNGFTGDSLIGARFLAESPELELVPATRVVRDSLVLWPGERRVVVRYLGRGHSAGDLVVELPQEHIIAAGDLIVAPVPLVGSTSHPADFAATLERMLALRPRVIVPGHGPVQRDTAYAREVIRLLQSVRDQVGAAVARGETLAEVRKSVDLTPFRDRFAGGSRLQRFVFLNYVTLSSVAAAFADLGPDTLRIGP